MKNIYINRGTRALFLILLSFLFVVPNALAQNPGKKYTVSVNNSNLSTALPSIQKQISDYKFGYDKKLIESNNKQISFSLSNVPINEILSKLSLQSGMDFKVVGQNIVVTKSTTQTTQGSTMLQQKVAAAKGKVIDKESGEVIIGASVVVVGTQTGSVTDIEGNFDIPKVTVGSVLEINYLGYMPSKVTFSGESLSIALIVDSKQLEEVVVVGFSTQKKVNLTGAVNTVKSDEINDRPITQASQALQGLASGVYVNTSSGEPGNDKASITIRGVGSLNQSSQPLVLIDGIEGSIDNVSPSDIENISVLKDAAAASIYGTRGAQGVILVTTKRGKFNNVTTISYNGYGGFSKPTVIPDVVTDNRTYLQAYRTAADNCGLKYTFTDADIDRYAAMPSTDYRDYAIKKSAPITSHEISASGGTKNVAYFISLGYMYQEGWLKGNNNSNRYSVRSNLDAKLTERLDLGSSLSYITKQSDLTPKENNGLKDAGSKGSTVLSSAIIAHPMVPIFTSEGFYAQQEQRMGINTNRPNIQGIIDNETGELNEESFTGNIWLNYNFGKGFSAKLIMGVNYENSLGLLRRKEFTSYDFVTGNMLSDGNSLRNSGSFLQLTNDKMMEVTNQLLVSYNRTFHKHDIKAFIGFNRQERRNDYSQVEESQFGSADLVFIGFGTAKNTSGRIDDRTALVSVFGRFNYIYDNRYLFEANFRQDASSRFASNKRWGTFPSFSGGWIVSNEKFWGESFFNTLKVRASWGKLGTEPSDRYGYRNQFLLGYDYVDQSGGAIDRKGNDNLKWEETENFDIGLNTSFFQNRLTVEADYFIRTTRDILVELDNPLTMGITKKTTYNAASMENKGWEVTVNYKTNIGQFKLGLGANLSNIKNKVLTIDPNLSYTDDKVEINRANNIWWIRGEPINVIYGLKFDGVFKSQAEIDAVDHKYITGAKPQLGDMKFVDRDNNDVIDENDRMVLGNRNPEWFYGFNINLGFKNFELNALFQGIGDAYTNLARETGPFPFAGLRTYWLDAWSPENPTSNIPRLWVDRRGYNGTTIEGAGKYSSFWMQNTRYLRLKNLQIAYNLPISVCNKMKINKARVFINGQNLLTFTGLKDFDPERNMLQNHATSTLPQSVTITGGLNLTF